MSDKMKWLLAALPAAVLAAGCDVDKVEDGEMPEVGMSYEEGELPEYEVRQTQEGRMPNVDVDVDGGKLPEYDVDAAEVRIGTKEAEVKVPDVDVDMEEKKVTVPDVDIDMPDDDDEPR